MTDKTKWFFLIIYSIVPQDYTIHVETIKG